MNQKPTQAFVMAAWSALGVGILTYMIGLWNASISLSEKGFYLTILLFGLFGAVSVQKNVRDQLEGMPVTNIYYSISWVATLLPILLLIVGLFNAEMLLSEKGFYGVAFVLSLFAAVVVQKNTRDAEVAEVGLKQTI